MIIFLDIDLFAAQRQR